MTGRTYERVLARRDAGVAAMKTPAGQKVCKLLGVEISSLERWDTGSGRRWYIGLAGQDTVHGHRSHEFRTASSLNALVYNWRRAQGSTDNQPPQFTSQEASYVLSLFHKAVEDHE